MSSKIYLAGSLKNPEIPYIANILRAEGYEVFDDWFSPGPEADDHWQEYEKTRGRSYQEALNGTHAENVYSYDIQYLSEADIVLLILPCGKSAHLELGWARGQGKRGYVLFTEEPDRFDIMYKLCTGVCFSIDEFLKSITK